MITTLMNPELTSPTTEEEVRKALFMMHPKKVSGFDGITTLFFQLSLQVIKRDLLDLINDFL